MAQAVPRRTEPFYVLLLVSVILSMTLDLGVWSQSNDAWIPSLETMDESFNGNISSGCRRHYCPASDHLSANSVDCQCDPDCWKRRDCCLDAWHTALDDLQADIHRPASVEQLISNDRLTCQSVVTRHDHAGLKVVMHFAMVTQCRNGSEVHGGISIEQCAERTSMQQDPLKYVPVTSHVTNLTYRNIFCAICNEDSMNLSFWRVNFSCQRQTPIYNVTDAIQHFLNSERQTKCNLELLPISGAYDEHVLPVHKCKKPPARTPLDDGFMVTECPARWEKESHASGRTKVSWLCRTIYSPVYVKRRSYRNIYCALCDDAISQSGNKNNTELAAKCYKHKQSFMSSCPPRCPPRNFIRTKSFTLLMDVDLRGGGLMVGTLERCPAAHVYDVFHGECRVIVCGKGYEYGDGVCKRTVKHPFVIQRLVTAVVNGSVDGALQQRADCLRIRYEAEEVDLYANQTLVIRKTGQTFLPGEYQLETGRETATEAVLPTAALVCTDMTNTYVTKFPEFAFEYVTIGGSILSVMALFVKMAIFTCLPETRNFPDRIVFCLSLSLFVAQSLFATTITNTDGRWQVACLMTAILTHYFFLSAFTWMNVLAFDVWRTFSTIEAAMHITSKRHGFLRYSAYAWGAPLGIVTTSVLLDYSGILHTDSPYRPYYGLAVCWISGRLALTYVFVIPIGLLIAANTVLFLSTAWNIRSSSKQASIVQTSKHLTGHRVADHRNKNQQLQFFLYVKLGMVMGLTWISGFVAILASISFIWYVFTLLNSLQGIYVFIAFTPYRKMRRIWRKIRVTKYSYGQGSYANSHLPLRHTSTNLSRLTQTSSLDNP